jgi:hypothetical protein
VGVRRAKQSVPLFQKVKTSKMKRARRLNAVFHWTANFFISKG